MSSRPFYEKNLPLFNAKSIEDLKRIIQENPVNSDYRYSGAWHGEPGIPLKIDNYGIAKLADDPIFCVRDRSPKGWEGRWCLVLGPLGGESVG